MTSLLAIDPGSTQSAYAVIDSTDCRPVEFGKIPNDKMLIILDNYYGPLYIEMIASYGMAVGAEVFDTCVWIGRFMQAHLAQPDLSVELVKRQEVRMHHCHNGRLAKDANVIQALRDRFAYGQPNYGKGTKAAPGWFYGFAKDVWQAYALAVYAADQLYVRTLAVAL